MMPVTQGLARPAVHTWHRPIAATAACCRRRCCCMGFKATTRTGLGKPSALVARPCCPSGSGPPLACRCGPSALPCQPAGIHAGSSKLAFRGRSAASCRRAKATHSQQPSAREPVARPTARGPPPVARRHGCGPRGDTRRDRRAALGRPGTSFGGGGGPGGRGRKPNANPFFLNVLTLHWGAI